ncbi:MAG: hypothetical protein QXW71_06640 [Thermoplasmata archaeon]
MDESTTLPKILKIKAEKLKEIIKYLESHLEDKEYGYYIADYLLEKAKVDIFSKIQYKKQIYEMLYKTVDAYVAQLSNLEEEEKERVKDILYTMIEKIGNEIDEAAKMITIFLETSADVTFTDEEAIETLLEICSDTNNC